MKLVNGSGFPRQLTEWAHPLKSKEITIISYIYHALTASGMTNKKVMLPRMGFFIFKSFEDKEKQIDNDLLEIFVSAKL